MVIHAHILIPCPLNSQTPFQATPSTGKNKVFEDKIHQTFS